MGENVSLAQTIQHTRDIHDTGVVLWSNSGFSAKHAVKSQGINQGKENC